MSPAMARYAFLFLCCMAFDAWSADPISVTNVVAFREVRSANSIGVVPGDHLKIGALTITPNPFGGDNGTVGTSVVAFAPGSSVAEPINFVFSPASPTEFSSSRFFFQDAWADSWTLVVSNPESANSPVTVTTHPVRRANGSIPPVMPFVQDMSISGTGTNVTFHFTPPSGAPVSNASVRIWDRDRVTPTGAVTLIYIGQVPFGATSHTPPAVLNISGDTLQMGGQYTVGIQLQEGGPFGTISRSASYFNFSPLAEGSPPSAFLPVVGPDGVYNFTVNTADPVIPIFIDPAYAVAYEYATGPGDPNFRSVILPNVGDGQFGIQVFDGSGWHDGGTVSAATPYFFGIDGVSRFRVTGIEVSAGLDPRNPGAFVTGLTFVTAGRFTGTMTPLTSVPDITPPVVSAVIGGTLGLNGWYTSPVTVGWSVVDAESAITSLPCASTTLSSDTASTTLGCSATSAGGTSSSVVTVRIDSTPPTITCSATPNVLWPPNNKLVDISVAVTASDAGSGISGFHLASVTSSEAGAGDATGWVLGTPDVQGQLRASRSGSGNGRTYTLVYRAFDNAGNPASCAATVTVPHDKGH